MLDTYATFQKAVDGARGARPINYNEKSGKREGLPTYDRDGREPGPAFVNVKTYRYWGHSMSDPQKYRSKDEVTDKREVDCINRLVVQLQDAGRATEAQCEAMDAKAQDVAKAAIAFAEASDPMPIEELFTDVYANPFGPYKKGAPNPDFA